MDIDISALLQGRERACYIFGAGEFYGLGPEPSDSDLVIAADGGLRQLKKLGSRPNIILGDFDSGNEAEARSCASELGAELVKLNVVKDVSDSAAAIDIGLERGFECFYLYGCTGGRLDHTLANIQDMAMLSKKGISSLMFDKGSALTAVTDGRVIFPRDGLGRFISVFSHSDSSRGIWETGLKYELRDAELKNSFPLGLSNEFIGREASVSVNAGTLIVYFETSS